MSSKVTVVAVTLMLAVGITACGKKPLPIDPTPTLTSVSISPGTDMIRIQAGENFTLTATYSDGSTQSVQGTWSSDTTAVATVDASSGRVTGVSSGQATIIGTYQGIRGTRLIRVVPDYHGRWDGDMTVTGCTESGDWAGICADEFPVSTLLGFTLTANQTRDTITGTTDFGDELPGPVTGTIGVNGHLNVSGSYAINLEGLSLQFTVSNWDTNSTNNQTMTGTLRVSGQVAGLQGSFSVDAQLHVVSKVSSSPSSFGGTRGGKQGLISAAVKSRR